MTPKNVSILSSALLLVMPAIALAQSSNASPPKESGTKEFTRRMVGPGAWVRSGAAAGFDQALTNPYEWGGGTVGFGRRFASAFGTHLVRSSIHFTIGKLLHEELDYQPSDKQGFGPRLKHALLSTVFTRKTTTGKRTVAIGEMSGITAGGFLSRLWHPVSYHTAASGFAATGTGFAVEAGMNVLHEFWPDIRHPHHRLKQPGSRGFQPSRKSESPDETSHPPSMPEEYDDLEIQ